MQETKIYYHVVFEDRFNNKRFLSGNIFTKNELLMNDISTIRKNEYLDKYPDKKFLEEKYLIDELKLVTDIGTVPVEVILNE